jgi:pyruvate,orthophosphate dikinase
VPSPASRVRTAVTTALETGTRAARAAAVLSVDTADVEQLLHKRFAADERLVLVRGVAASPGAATGRVYFTAEDAMDAADRGEHVILACATTSPADEIAMRLSDGILTSHGGMASHAAVVARGWGIPAVCGAEGIEFGEHGMVVGDVVVPEGDLISIDGGTGEVMLGALEIGGDPAPPELDTLLEWADEIREKHIAVRANADTGDDATRAREFGAKGVGLCRTEHQFLGDKLRIVQRFILARTAEDERAALQDLVDAQRDELTSVLAAMDGQPVTVRLLDPPLHEFLPAPDDPSADHALLAASRTWREHNPMLGARGVRLGILKPALYRAQIAAIVEAVKARLAAGGDPRVEVMIPLVSDAAELALVRRWLSEEVRELTAAGVEVALGAMIETPRAALLAGELAAYADFFSIGTNDLTQLVYGFSRDDVERRLLGVYEQHGIVSESPFEDLDRAGVGALIKHAIAEGRARRPGLRIAVCGEHGGDPDSIEFFVEVGIDAVSCSPFRVPIARLAAAQAVLRSEQAASNAAGGKGRS